MKNRKNGKSRIILLSSGLSLLVVGFFLTNDGIKTTFVVLGILILLVFVVLIVIKQLDPNNPRESAMPSPEINVDRLIERLISSRRMNGHFATQNFLRSMQSYNTHPPSQFEDVLKKIRFLESEINKLKDEIKASNTNPISSTQKPQPLIKDEIKTSQPKPIPQTIAEVPSSDSEEDKQPPKIFYLSTPNSDGSFNASSSSETYKEGASIYVFKKMGTHKALFLIDERASSIKLAIQYPDRNIDPVCEVENAYNPKATRIITVKEGAATLINDKWQLSRKAIIRYEP